MTTASSELVKFDPRTLTIQDARTALEQIEDPSNLGEIRAKAIAYETFSKAQQARDAYFTAGSIRIWTERRAGQIRRELPEGGGGSPSKLTAADGDKIMLRHQKGVPIKQIARELGIDRNVARRIIRLGGLPQRKAHDVPRRDFDAQMGITNSTGRELQKLASIDQRQLEEILEHQRSVDASLSVRAVLMRAKREGVVRVEQGIMEHADGRYEIGWRSQGQYLRKMMPPGTDLRSARKSLIEQRHLDSRSRPPSPGGTTIQQAYGELRACLATLDRYVPKAKNPRQINNLISHLHESEDLLSQALIMETV